MEIYLKINGEQRGPYTTKKVLNMLKQGQIRHSESAWKEGLPDWIAVNELLEVNSPPPIVPSGNTFVKQVATPVRKGIGIDEIGEYSRTTLQKDETTLYYTTLHWVIFIRAGIFWLLLQFFSLRALLMVGGGFATLLWCVVWAALLFLPAYISYKTSEFTVTDRRLIVKIGFISRKTHEIFISKLESVSVDQGILERMFGAGTITTIGTGGSKQKFVGVSTPLQLRSAIQEIQSEI